MKKSILILIPILSLFVIGSCKKDKHDPPVLTTATITNISYTTAISGGSVTNDGGVPIISKGICWNTGGSPTLADSTTNSGTGTGIFVSNLSNLIPNTMYYVRAYATNNVGTAFGNQLSFTTLEISVPSLSTVLPTSVTQNSATSGGTNVNADGESITSSGICWSVKANPTIADSKTTDGSTSGDFISNLSGLTPNTIYYVRAYAINSLGVGYGDQKTVTTNPVSAGLTTGLIGYYPFNGDANDISGNNNNGVVYGATLASDIFNHPNSAYSFDGISNYISLPANLLNGENSYSICVWMKPTIVPYNGGGMIYGIGSSTVDAVQGLTYQSSSTIFAGTYNSGSSPMQSYSKSCCYDPNKWIFVVVTRDNSIINLYINGTLIAAQASSSTNGQGANYGNGISSAIIGARSNLSYQNYFTGIIDEVRIYNRILDASEITELKGLNQ
jgi:hypothetical protein